VDGVGDSILALGIASDGVGVEEVVPSEGEKGGKINVNGERLAGGTVVSPSAATFWLGLNMTGSTVMGSC
jgi:hypothetical protein